MIEFRCDTCGETALSLTDLRHHAELRHPRKAPQGPTGMPPRHRYQGGPTPNSDSSGRQPSNLRQRLCRNAHVRPIGDGRNLLGLLLTGR